MTTHEAKAMIDSICRGLNQALPDLYESLWSPDYIGHGPRGDFGLEVIRRSHAASRKVFSDLKTEAQLLFAAGDMIAVRYSFTGTNDGMFHGRPPTGAVVTACGMSVLRVSNGRIAEEWFVFDELGQLRQLGAVPEAG
jgi:predicted ester cyclase